MIPRTILICFLFLPLPMLGQSGPWSAWEAGLVRSLNSAGESDYLNEEEKKVILFMNMARHDGPLFAQTFLQSYLQEKSLDNSSYIRSLQRDLKKTKGLAPLMPQEDLTAVAQGHAQSSGEKGTTGHSGFKKRFEPLLGNPYTHVGENCSYGYEQAIDIVISLLIDEGIKSLGHRNNMLSRDFNSIGVAFRPHRKYRINCVMDFGSTSAGSMNEVPY
ncbi:MAG: CAP domain-containing protein [Bacteroidales bacterium]|nr:CAP domain-containing protein [Bacteroidales bacterium]